MAQKESVIRLSRKSAFFVRSLVIRFGMLYSEYIGKGKLANEELYKMDALFCGLSVFVWNKGICQRRDFPDCRAP